jgi:hypothetical protein
MNKQPAANLLIAVLAILIGMGPAWCGCLNSFSHEDASHQTHASSGMRCERSLIHDAGRADVSYDCEIACPECTGIPGADNIILAAKVETPSPDFQIMLGATAFELPAFPRVAFSDAGGQRAHPPITPTTLYALRVLLLD